MKFAFTVLLHAGKQKTTGTTPFVFICFNPLATKMGEMFFMYN